MGTCPHAKVLRKRNATALACARGAYWRNCCLSLSPTSGNSTYNGNKEQLQPYAQPNSCGAYRTCSTHTSDRAPFRSFNDSNETDSVIVCNDTHPPPGIAYRGSTTEQCESQNASEKYRRYGFFLHRIYLLSALGELLPRANLSSANANDISKMA